MKRRSQETQTGTIRTIRESSTFCVPYEPAARDENGVSSMGYEIIAQGKYSEELLVGYGEYPDCAANTHLS
jgi:hypothetical protein